jgi:hypothetical protein
VKGFFFVVVVGEYNFTTVPSTTIKIKIEEFSTQR